MNKIIDSVNNPQIKEIIKIANGKNQEFILLEGKNLSDEANNLNLAQKILTTDYSYKNENVPIIYINEKIANKIKKHKTASNFFTIIKANFSKKPLLQKILICDGIQDPGNLGSIIRSAVAFNFDTIMLKDNTVNLNNHKLITATQGNLFKIAFLDYNKKLVEKLNLPIITLDGNKDIKLPSKNFSNVILVCGNEGHGISDEIKQMTNFNFKIKTENVESLNVAAATAIALYEVSKNYE